MSVRHAARALLPAALFLAAAALVVAITWPWAAHWRGAFLDHWDPPFHAWKLEFMARRILAGDVLLSSGNTNMLYPHSGTLYYEALQYPPALFAALLFGLTPLPSELVYHVTLLVFWALSAPCMYFLLRTLACGRAAASFGALAFCIVPWRVSYAPEFQMELVFAIPLVFAFLVRFLRDRRATDAALCALSWWLLAVSELYEAVFVALAAPIVALALLRREPGMLRERRFWIGALAAGAAGLASLLVLVGPYLTQRGEGAVLRPLKETAMHAAQPLSYLIPYGRLALWDIHAREDELSLYPTLAVLGLAAAAAVLFARRILEGRGGAWRKAVFAAAAACGSASVFALAAVRPRLWPAAAVAATIAGAVPLALSVRSESVRSAFLRGLAAAATLCLLLSFGPQITAGIDGVNSAPNPVYLLCHDLLLPFLSAFRVVSRFGVVVLFFLICLAAAALDRMAGRLRGRRLRIAVAGLAIAAVAAEAVPERGPAPAFRPVERMREEPSVVRLLADRVERTIVDFPMGYERRWSDAMRKFALVKGDWPCVYAWGGYFPPWADRIRRLYIAWDFETMHGELAKLYPEALVLLDLAPRKEIAAKRPPGRQAFRPGWWDERPDNPVRPRHLASIATIRYEDGRFAWLDLKPVGAQPICEKIFRSDLARTRPVCEARVRTQPGSVVGASFNGVAAVSAKAGDDGVAPFRFRLLDAAPTEPARPNVVAFSAVDGPCELLSFELCSETNAEKEKTP